MYVNHVSDKTSIFKIYEKLIQLNSKKTHKTNFKNVELKYGQRI